MKRKFKFLALSSLFVLSSLGVTMLSNHSIAKIASAEESTLFSKKTLYSNNWDNIIANDASELWAVDRTFACEVSTASVKTVTHNTKKGLEVTLQGNQQIHTLGNLLGDGGLSKCVVGEKYTFQLYIDASLADGADLAIQLQFDNWTGVAINNGVVRIFNGATVTRASYENNILSFDFIATSDPSKAYAKITTGNAQEGNTVFMDDFLIYQDIKPANYVVFANNFDNLEVGATSAPNVLPAEGSSLNVAQTDNGNKYVRFQGDITTDLYRKFYLHQLNNTNPNTIQSDNRYRLSFDVIGDGWDEFSINLDESHFAAGFNKETLTSISDFTNVHKASMINRHVTFEYTPSTSYNEKFYMNLYFVIKGYENSQLDFGIDNIQIEKMNIIPDTNVFANNFDNLETGATSAPNVLPAEGSSLNVAQTDNGNKYVRFQGDITTDLYRKFYLHQLNNTNPNTIQSDNRYRLSFDVIGDGWDEFSINLDESHFAAGFNKETLTSISDFTNVHKASMINRHVTFEYTPSTSYNEKFYMNLYFVIKGYENSQLDFGIDNIQIDLVGSMPVFDAVDTIKIETNGDITSLLNATLTYPNGDVREVTEKEMRYDLSSIDLTTAGDHYLYTYIVDEMGYRYEDAVRVHVHGWKEKTVITAPTYFESGTSVFECSCGDTKTMEVPPLVGHVVEFVNEWHTLRVNGSICEMLEPANVDKLNKMIAKYESYSDDEKAAIASATDIEGVTIGETIEYLKTLLNYKETEKSDSRSVIITAIDNNQANVIVLFTILGFIPIVCYIVALKKKKAN